MLRSFFMVAIGATLTVATARAAEPITLQQLIGEMTDLAALSEWPQPAYTSGQFSSYDRKSEAPGDESWFANADAGNYLRVEERDGRKEFVMMDAAGPGVIHRIWSANPAGTLRFYFDGSDTPAWTVPMGDLLGAKLEALPEPISGVRAAGWNLYFPIPYAAHCKVTCDAGGFYYIINHRTYPAGTKLETFEPAQLERYASAIERYRTVLATPRLAEAGAPNAVTIDGTATVPAGGTQPLMKIDGFEGAERILLLQLRVLDAEDVDRALRETILHISFDGNETVQTPLGDFFGSAPGINAYDSLPLSMTPDGKLVSRWVMPMQRQATITLRNLGTTPVKVSGLARVGGYNWHDRSLYFHAGWRATYDVKTRPIIDWTYADLKGQGAVVGAAFHVNNPVRNWWGEGDEKIYVDGETFPSFFGTGTEDYFGYAWCSPATFEHALHNQTRCDGPGNRGHSSVNRFHIADRITFEESLLFDMEIWHHVDTVIDAHVTMYWYARPGSQDGYAPLTADNVEYRVIEPHKVPKVAGALEGEDMKVIARTANASPQWIDPCSGSKHLWWRDTPKPGDELVLGFEVPTGGTYQVYARFLMAGDYGKHRLTLNETPIDRTFDLYHPTVKPTEEIALGSFDLAAGENRLTVECVGTNEKAVKKYMFGLDYLRLEAVQE